MSTNRMPCHISDGPQTPEDADELWGYKEEDEDAAYERHRQQERDDEGQDTETETERED